MSFGRQIRDYLHIYDLNRVIEKLIDNNKIKNLIFNLGSGNPIMVKTIIKKIIKIVKKGRPIYGALNINSGEIPIFYPDINRIKKYLGWKPKVDINQGISKLINFIN